MAWFSLRFPRSESRCRFLPPEVQRLGLHLQPHDGPNGSAIEYLVQQVGAIGNDPVNTQVEQPLHLARLVDRPHVELGADPVVRGDEPTVDLESGLGVRQLIRLYR